MTEPAAYPSLTRDRWGLARDADIRRVSWEDACVVFHGASGETHLVEGLAAALLACLDEAPAGLAELADRIAALREGPPRDPTPDGLVHALSDLLSLGLVERSAGDAAA